jgi:hypothetical protein
MPSRFEDHPRKKIVRETWDTPALRWLYQKWGAKYFYFGLPGAEAADVKIWSEMIGGIIEFEVEREGTSNPRENIQELSRNLTLMGIPYLVYCGFMEEVVLDGEDRDGQKLSLDEFVTLFNLDFCNRISGRIDTIEGRRCRRFEAIREVIALQRNLFRTTGANKFIMLITAFDSLHVTEIERFISNPDLPEETAQFVRSVLDSRPLPQRGYVENTDLIKAFVFSFLREYLHGQNVSSVFLPPVYYMGRTIRSPMVHFVVVCYMESQEQAQVVDSQSAEEFLNLNLLHATDNRLEVATVSSTQGNVVQDPVVFLRGFDSIIN